MFYLVTQCEKGSKLADVGVHSKHLIDKISGLLKEDPASLPVVLDDKAIRAGFLVDGNGVVALDEGDILVPLSDLL